MDGEGHSGAPEKRQIGGELVIPVAALIFTLYYFSTIYDTPWTAQVSAFFIGAILITLIVIFLVKSAIAWKGGEVGLGLDLLVAPRTFLGKRLALFALTLGFIVVVDWAGFTLTTLVFLSLAMLVLSGGRKIGFILALSTALSIGGYLLFILAFETRFPAGPFELFMKQVL
jgi:hypothetical protein